jgi:Trp operon repressor
MNEEDMKLYRKRQLEIHEETMRERQAQADVALAHAVSVAKVLRGGNAKRPRSR